MKRRLIIALLGGAFLPGANEPGDAAPAAPGPRLLVAGDGYAIHVFRGLVAPPPAARGFVHGRPVRTGVVIFHTDFVTHRSTWLVHTGVRALPTRRVSYSVSRVIGLFATDAQLAVARYDVLRSWSPQRLEADKGSYRVEVFDRKTGRRVLEHVLPPIADRPNAVPEETTEPGVIRPAKNGFTVFGQPFVVRGGRIAPRE